MQITIITLFPEVFDPILNSSILKRAQIKGKVTFKFVNLRDFGQGHHKVVDGRPYGGGAGMVLRADILAKALESVPDKPHVILTSASGKPYKQTDARRLSKINYLVIVCGHYEGIDQRFIDKYVTEEISIGDFILTGGEISAMVIADSIVRLLPGVLKKEEATINESFTENLLEGPQYTRPGEFDGAKVPEVLLSGHHKKVSDWRRQKSLERTRQVRPDLLK